MEGGEESCEGSRSGELGAGGKLRGTVQMQGGQWRCRGGGTGGWASRKSMGMHG